LQQNSILYLISVVVEKISKRNIFDTLHHPKG
jgi:hypothetical protein